jgi:hypothetical protein
MDLQQLRNLVEEAETTSVNGSGRLTAVGPIIIVPIRFDKTLLDATNWKKIVVLARDKQHKVNTLNKMV